MLSLGPCVFEWSALRRLRHLRPQQVTLPAAAAMLLHRCRHRNQCGQSYGSGRRFRCVRDARRVWLDRRKTQGSHGHLSGERPCIDPATVFVQVDFVVQSILEAARENSVPFPVVRDYGNLWPPVGGDPSCAFLNPHVLFFFSVE